MTIRTWKNNIYIYSSRGRAFLSARTHARYTCGAQHRNNGLDVDGVDVVLSSGFLAFGSHCGFLQAVVDSDIKVRGIMGTSSGALTGALFATQKFTISEIAAELRKPPIESIKLSGTPWKGVFSLDPATQRLRELLPADFAELELEFSCGVAGPNGHYECMNSGRLPEAVVASAAVPFLFTPVRIPGRGNQSHIDGGVVTRVGLDLWREQQITKYGFDKPPPAVVHIVGRSSPFSGSDTVSEGNSKDAIFVFSPKSRASLFQLKDFDIQFHAAYASTMHTIEKEVLSVKTEGKSLIL
jgi:predicted acylesterase/phospholipase RssA